MASLEEPNQPTGGKEIALDHFSPGWGSGLSLLGFIWISSMGLFTFPVHSTLASTTISRFTKCLVFHHGSLGDKVLDHGIPFMVKDLGIIWHITQKLPDRPLQWPLKSMAKTPAQGWHIGGLGCCLSRYNIYFEPVAIMWWCVPNSCNACVWEPYSSPPSLPATHLGNLYCLSLQPEALLNWSLCS